MKTRITLVVLALCVLAGGLLAAEKKPQPLTIDIIDLQGKKAGTATFSEAESGGLKLDLNITHMYPGTHTFHIHNDPVCDPKEGFNTSHLRFDPTHEFYGDKEHHIHPQAAPSAGDPGKGIEVGPDGTGKGTFYMPKLTLGEGDNSVVRGSGTAITFHGVPGEPDNETGRVACGVIARKR